MFSSTGKLIKVLAMLLLTIILLIAISPMCSANSAEPPSIIIVVPNAPADLNISVNIEDGEIEGSASRKFMETQFRFFSFGYKSGTEYSINVTYGNIDETILLGSATDNYHNIYELDYKNLNIKTGTSRFRSWLYTVIRILLTLAIEALIFFAFLYRERRSWLTFLIINLITQGILNIWLGTFISANAYLILALVVIEVFVILAELIGFLIFIKEHRKVRTVMYVIIANVVSLLLGGFLIMLMPM